MYAKIRAVQNPDVCLNSAPHFFCLHFQQSPEKLLTVCIQLFHRSPTSIRSSFSLMKTDENNLMGSVKGFND